MWNKRELVMSSKEQRQQEGQESGGAELETSSGSNQTAETQSVGSNSALAEQVSEEMPQVCEERLNLPNPVAPDGHRNYYIDRNLDFVVRYSNIPEPPKYYIDYGDKYIARFSDETKALLSPEGKEWLARARVNLQVAIESEREASPMDYDALEKDNDAFQSFAMGTHADAYWSAGLGDLGAFDLAHIALTPDAKDLFALDGVKQTVDIGTRLLGLWGESAVDYAMGEGSASDVVNAIYEGYSLVGDGIDTVFGQGTASTLEAYSLQLGTDALDLGYDAYDIAASVIEGGADYIDDKLGEGTVEGALNTGREKVQDAITTAETAYDWAAEALSELF
jgi:hypothetical protein